jgi:hypothetical protein
MRVPRFFFEVWGEGTALGVAEAVLSWHVVVVDAGGGRNAKSSCSVTSTTASALTSNLATVFPVVGLPHLAALGTGPRSFNTATSALCGMGWDLSIIFVQAVVVK